MICQYLSKFIFCLLLFISTPALGAWHLYVVPIVGTGNGLKDGNRPKYFDGRKYQALFFGQQRIALVAADVSDEMDTALQSNTDVVRLPDNLDQQIGAALATVQSRLESRNIPADWITGTTTYRTVLKTVIGIFTFMNRFPIITGDLSTFIDNNKVTLNTTWSQLPLLAQQRLAAVAKSMNLDTSSVTGATTLRQLLKGVSDQWLAKVGGIKLGAITIARLSLRDRVYKALWRGFFEPAIAWASSGSDNFNGANRNPIDNAKWATPSGWNPLQVFNNAVRRVTGLDGLASFIGFMPADDQSASITMTVVPDHTYQGLVVRFDSATGYTYMGGCTPDSGNFFIIFVLLPEFNILASDVGLGSCAAGARLNLSVTGYGATGLSLKLDGNEVLTGDASALTSGRCGFRIEVFEDWDGLTEPEADDFHCVDSGGETAVLRRRGLFVQ